MRTQQYSQIEAIVAKYRKLASNTDRVKAIEKEIKFVEKEIKFGKFYDLPYDIERLNFVQQLIARIYKLWAGTNVNAEVEKHYSEAYSFYIKGMLSEEEEQFLVDHFNEFIDYTFEHFWLETNSEPLFLSKPYEWSRLVPYLLENKSGKIFIPSSNYGREFDGLTNCTITVGDGFVNAAIRAFACGLDIHSYKFDDYIIPSLSDIEDGQFDAAVIATDCYDDNLFDNFLRIVKDGGDILLCISKGIVLSKSAYSFRSNIVASKIIKEVILLPSGNVLLHCVKKEHDSIVMFDASGLSKKSNERVVDVDTFLKETKMTDMPERKDCPISRRYSYEQINDILLPTYYLQMPNTGTPLSQIVKVAEDIVHSNECSPSEKLVTVNNLSNVFTKGDFKVENLPCVNLDRVRQYYRVEGPAVIMAVSEQDIAIGYTADSSSFLVPENLYALKPQKGIDVKYLASMLLCNSVKEQLTRLVFNKNIFARLAYHWNDYTLMELHSEQEQQKLVQNAMLKDYVAQEHFISLQEKGFKHSIRLRKHALSQNISAFDSLFRSLENCMSEHKGELKASERLSPVSTITVADAMEILHSNLDVICERVNHLTDEQDWGACEVIDPEQFIKDYMKQHKGMDFRFKHSFRTNTGTHDIRIENLLIRKGDPYRAAWFPKRALQQVFDNIVANAREHGFTDKSRKDYVIQTSWTTDGLNMHIEIANNGIALPSDIDTNLMLEYGYTTALNQNGHAGIGGGEMAEIMHKFGGNVRIISTPDKEFTVRYVLSMPLASIY